MDLVSVSASRIVGLRGGVLRCVGGVSTRFSIRESDRWVERIVAGNQCRRGGRFSIRESDRWVESHHLGRMQYRIQGFSIRESDRWVERVETFLPKEPLTPVSVSASRIVGLRDLVRRKSSWTLKVSVSASRIVGLRGFGR